MTDLVRRGEATLGLRYFRSDRPDLVELAAGSESMLVVAARDHRLAGRRAAHARDLASERWIGFPPSPGDRDFIGPSAGTPARSAPDWTRADLTLIDSLTAQKRLAQAGFGLALVPRSSVRDELRQGMLVALDVPAMRTISRSPPCTAATATSAPQPRLCSSC